MPRHRGDGQQWHPGPLQGSAAEPAAPTTRGGARKQPRRVRLDALYTSTGEPLGSPTEVVNALGDVWQPIFNAQAETDADDETFFLYVQPLGHRMEWRWPSGLTRDVAAKAHHSSPGCDGLPYAFWAHCPGALHEALDLAVGAMQEGQDMPAALHGLTTVFIPKADIWVNPGLIRPSSGIVRRITFIPTGQKLVCIVINDASWKADDPSLSHTWLSTVPRHMEPPPAVIAIIRGLSWHMATHLGFRGESVARTALSSGIRHGSPPSVALSLFFLWVLLFCVTYIDSDFTVHGFASLLTSRRLRNGTLLHSWASWRANCGSGGGSPTSG